MITHNNGLFMFKNQKHVLSEMSVENDFRIESKLDQWMPPLAIIIN